MTRIMVAVVLLVGMAVPAAAHSWRDLNDWLDHWHPRLDRALALATGRIPGTVEQQGQLAAVLAEYDDMLARHPEWDGGYQTAPPRPAPEVYRGLGSDVERWRPLVATHFAPGDVDRVLCLMGYESGGNPAARHPRSSATGLMQILYSLWGPPFGLTSRVQLEDPDLNLRVARFIRDTQGWVAWSPYNRGLCR